LYALATAWDLESTERHTVLLQTMIKDNAERYLDSLAEAAFFNSVMVKRFHQQLKDDADFTIAAYTHDLTAHSIADKQLDYLEEIGAEQSLSLEDPVNTDMEDVKNHLNEYLDSILEEGKKMIIAA
jgi:hypothetical protein